MPESPAPRAHGNRRCPDCGTSYPPDVVICIDCGVDLRTGTRLATEVGPAPEPSPPPDTPPASAPSGPDAPPDERPRNASTAASGGSADRGPTREEIRGRAPRARPAAMPGPVVQVVAGWMPGVLFPGVLLASLVCLGVGLPLLFFCGLMLALAPLSAVFIGALGMVIYAQAVAMLVLGRLDILHELLVEFRSRQWSTFAFLVVGPVVHFVIVLALGASG